jgi:hypothetical protein
MAKFYIGISTIIFAVVAIGHVVRIMRGWQVQLGDIGVAMSVSWVALVVSAALTVWGVVLLRR